MNKFDTLGKASESFSEAVLKHTDSDWMTSLNREIEDIRSVIEKKRKEGQLRVLYALDAIYLSDTRLNEEILLPLKLLGYRIEYKYYLSSGHVGIYISWDKKEVWPLEWSA